MVKSFKCKVIREDSYTIEIDDSVIDKNFMKDFSEVLYDVNSIEDVVKDIARLRAENHRSFIEGYGAPLINGKKSCIVEEDEIQPAINIIEKENESNDIEVKIEEIQKEKYCNNLEGAKNE